MSKRDRRVEKGSSGTVDERGEKNKTNQEHLVRYFSAVSKICRDRGIDFRIGLDVPSSLHLVPPVLSTSSMRGPFRENLAPVSGIYHLSFGGCECKWNSHKK